MSLNESDLKGVLTCSYCDHVYEQPIMLPCQERICKKDLANLYMKSSSENIKFRSFKCPCCNVIHEEPLTGFPEDIKIKKILELHGVGNSNSFTLARTCCANLSDLYVEYMKLKENPYSFIDKYFNRIRKMIEDNRQENKQILDQIYDEFLKDLKKVYFSHVLSLFKFSGTPN